MLESAVFTVVILLALLIVLVSVLIGKLSSSTDRIIGAIKGIYLECNYPIEDSQEFD